MAQCSCCGRATVNHLYVEVVNGGASVAEPGSNPDQNDGGYMGFFPVGRSCAKKYFNGYTHEHIL